MGSACSSGYRRRRPERTVLYEAIRRHYQTFRSEVEANDRTLPGFVTRELEKFSRCGILAHGFARVHCGACGHDRLVAYSCKGRGFCPSCIGRRMADTAARLTDQVFPDVPTRTWTLTLPQPLRYLVAYDNEVLSDVIAAYTKAVFNWQRNRAKSVLGLLRIDQAHPGMATWIQRFGSAANLNVHLHSLGVDGVFVEVAPGTVEWRGLPEPQSHDVATIAWEVCTRVVKALQRRGLSLAGESGDIDALAEREPLLAACYAASLRGFVATGRRAGLRVMQMGVPIDPQDGKPSSVFGHGFNLYAGKRIAGSDRRKREHVIRYMARPPIPEGALSWTDDGNLLLKLKRAWSNGVTHLKLTGPELIERLVSLVPRPRTHLVRYHGVLAPNARLRSAVVQKAPQRPTSKEVRKRFNWAELMMRVFELDVTRCPKCGTDGMQVLACIDEPLAVQKILTHIGEPAAPPRFEPAEPHDTFTAA